MAPESTLESGDDTATRELWRFVPPELAGVMADALARTGEAPSESLLFAHTRELDPNATMRALAPTSMTPRTRRDMEVWVPEAGQLPLLSLGASPEIAEFPLATSLAPESGADPPDLSVTGLLGEGGSGQVLLAYQRSMGREVAVKVPRDSEPWFAPTLLAEGRLAGRIEHPNVIPIYALGRSQAGAPILVMKRARGAPWETLLRDPSHPVWEAFSHRDDGRAEHLERHLGILLAVVQGISAAHRAGIVHRDVKPANVLVAGPDDVCVIDWGLALDLRDPRGAANLVGTPAYMAPEMLGTRPGVTVDERADVYELGATLHYLLSGRHRNAGATTDALLEGLRAPSAASLPESPPALAAIVQKATAFEPADRYPSAAAFGDAIRDWLDQRSAERIARSADERLDQLASAIGDTAFTPGALPETARAHLDRLASACRASIEDALALVPDLGLARDARVRYLELWVGHLLDRHDVDSARAELDEARGLAPELEARLERMENDAAERLLRLSSLEQDLDLRPAARARKRLFVAGIVYALALAGLAFGVLPRLLAIEDHQRYTPIAMAAVTNVLFWSVVYAARRRLLINAASRHIMGWFGVLVGSFLVHRITAIAFGGVTVQHALADEMLISAVLSAYAALAMSRRFWPAPVLSLAGHALGLAMPELAPHLFGATTVATLIVAARVWGRVTDR